MSASAKARAKKRLYTIPEAAEVLGRSVNSVREMIWKGRLPHVRIDRRVQVDVQDLEALIESSKLTGPA